MVLLLILGPPLLVASLFVVFLLLLSTWWKLSVSVQCVEYTEFERDENPLSLPLELGAEGKAWTSDFIRGFTCMNFR